MRDPAAVRRAVDALVARELLWCPDLVVDAGAGGIGVFARRGFEAGEVMARAPRTLVRRDADVNAALADGAWDAVTAEYLATLPDRDEMAATHPAAHAPGRAAGVRGLFRAGAPPDLWQHVVRWTEQQAAAAPLARYRNLLRTSRGWPQGFLPFFDLVNHAADTAPPARVRVEDEGVWLLAETAIAPGDEVLHQYTVMDNFSFYLSYGIQTFDCDGTRLPLNLRLPDGGVSDCDIFWNRQALWLPDAALAACPAPDLRHKVYQLVGASLAAMDMDAVESAMAAGDPPGVPEAAAGLAAAARCLVTIAHRLRPWS